MSDEFAQLAASSRNCGTPKAGVVSAVEVERHAWRQRRQMVALAGAEAGALALAFIAAVWIAMHTAFIAMSAITLVFVGVCGYLQHRLRREPPPAGDDDLLTSLDARMAHEEWTSRSSASAAPSRWSRWCDRVAGFRSPAVLRRPRPRSGCGRCSRSRWSWSRSSRGTWC